MWTLHGVARLLLCWYPICQLSYLLLNLWIWFTLRVTFKLIDLLSKSHCCYELFSFFSPIWSHCCIYLSARRLRYKLTWCECSWSTHWVFFFVFVSFWYSQQVLVDLLWHLLCFFIWIRVFLVLLSCWSGRWSLGAYHLLIHIIELLISVWLAFISYFTLDCISFVQSLYLSLWHRFVAKATSSNLILLGLGVLLRLWIWRAKESSLLFSCLSGC